MKVKSIKQARVARHKRVRRKISGTGERPRLAVSISNRGMYVQFIDDTAGRTLASASYRDVEGGHNVAGAGALGKRAGEAALSAGIRTVVVDRGGHKYHGRLKALVEAAVAAGLSVTARKE